jgi:hypothetical protein
MDTPKMEVKCSVDSCLFYNDSMCYAGRLEVNPQRSHPHNSHETSCTTFQPHTDKRPSNQFINKRNQTIL